MAISSLGSSSFLPPTLCLNSVNPRYTKPGIVRLPRQRPMKVSASCDHDNQDSKLVDEDMIVLRMRIHDINMNEAKGQSEQPPANWMEWEKRYYADYNSDIYEAVGLLQYQLMNTRPSLALGMLALLTLSVTLSTSMLMISFLDNVAGMLASGGIQF